MDTMNSELGGLRRDVNQPRIIVEKDIALEKLGKCVSASRVSNQQQMVSTIIGDDTVKNSRIRVKEHGCATFTRRHCNHLVCRYAVEEFKTTIAEKLNPPLMRPI